MPKSSPSTVSEMASPLRPTRSDVGMRTREAPRSVLGRIDLNLMLILSRLLELKSVSKVASELHVTQPAISNALARLRDLIGDPLLIKTKRGMEPTERALELVQPLRSALARISVAVENARPFNPATSEAEVVLAVDEYAAQLLVPAIAQRLLVEAPGLSIRATRVCRPGDTAMLAAGANHFTLCAPRADFGHLRSRVLADDGWLLLARPDHPALHGPLSLAQYAALPSVAAWHPDLPHPNWVDDTLALHGLKRNIAVRIATSSPVVTATSDYVMLVPSTLGRLFERNQGLRLHELPPELKRAALPYQCRLFWHAASDASPLASWMQQIILDVSSGIVSAKQTPAPLARAA